MIYTLTGAMGSGKSTVGRLLAARHGWTFVDLDLLIAETAGRSIPEIFRDCGENGFRDAETRALEDAVTAYEGGTMILSLGGGTLLREENRFIVRTVSHCIYLRATAATLAARLREQADGRPLLQGEGSLETKIARILADRSAIYEAAATRIVDTDGKTPAQVADEVEKLLYL